VDEELWQRLRAWRLEQARAQEVPAFVIFHDATLRRIAALRPADLNELASIKGIGPDKLEKYGREVLALVAEWEVARDHSPTQPPSDERSRPDHEG
jgi:superfamily II DNA helicase RecQ